MSVNKVIIVGRLGQDPDVRYTPGGAAVANFSVATSETWNDKSGQKQERTEWHKVVVWGKIAELCKQYLTKGRQVYLEGKLQTRQWQDKEGQTRYTTEVHAQTVQFLGSTSSEQRPQQYNNAPQSFAQSSASGAQAPAGASAYSGGYQQPVSSGAAGLNEEPMFTEDDIPF